MNNTYTVHGMTCGGCANAVTNAITKAAPNATVKVDLDAKTITVEDTDAATVKQAVEGAGFEFLGEA